MHVKVVPPDSWPTLDVEAVNYIKIASSGLRGNDLAEFIKRAGHKFADAVRRADLKPGDVPVHIIALSATEWAGANRNGDGFKEAACRDYHIQFVKRARCYRHHKNKDKSNSYGYVKESMYNDAMHRVELLAVYNGTKAAADRNGGLLADEELDLLEKNGTFPTSMATTVDFDLCSSCGNKAKNRSEYCTEDMCKHGGLKDHIGRVCEDGHVLHADNPHPMFFDISRVHKGADRTSHALGKVASTRPIIGGAQLAEEMGVTAPDGLLIELYHPRAGKMIRLAHKLAALENKVESTPNGLDLAFGRVQQDMAWDDHGCTKGEALAAMAKTKIAMPLPGFLRFTCDGATSDVAHHVSARLPGIYTRLVSDPGLPEMLESNGYCVRPSMPKIKLAGWCARRADDYSIDRKVAGRRAIRAALGGASPAPKVWEKASADGTAAEHLARQYALYKIALLHALDTDDGEFDAMCELAVRQNYHG